MIGRALNRLVSIVDRKQQNMERSDRERPDDTVGIITLFDGGGDQTGDADAVAAHFNRTLSSLGIEIGSTQRLTVFFPQIKDLAYFDAAIGFENTLVAAWTRIARDG